MTQAKPGDSVAVHYTGMLKDGSQFDSSDGRDPLSFTVGSGQVIKGFDDAVDGMEIGDSKTVVIPANDAYGERREELIQTVPRSDIPEHIELEQGMQLQAGQPGGQPMVLTVTDLTDETVTLDANHALAGEDLTFKIELVSVG